jgi:hypothetical protein
MEPGVAAELTRAVQSLPEPPPGKRVLRFWLRDRAHGGKLSFAQVQALLYCIGLATGKGNLPTTPPNKTIAGCACAPEPPLLSAAWAASAGSGVGARGPGGAATSMTGLSTGDESS